METDVFPVFFPVRLMPLFVVMPLLQNEMEIVLTRYLINYLR